jgi:hypothetical protein
MHFMGQPEFPQFADFTCMFMPPNKRWWFSTRRNGPFQPEGALNRMREMHWPQQAAAIIRLMIFVQAQCSIALD